MKKLIVMTLALVFACSLFAQKNTDAERATDELVKVYDLTDKQSEEMLVIQERKVRNLSQIEAIKNTDIRKYRHKRRAIQQGTDASIRRMLTDKQMQVYEKRRMEWRKARSLKIAELKESGKTQSEIEDALLEEGF